MSSKKRYEGWLMLDHTASPGIPEDTARRMGLNPREVCEGKRMEAATIACGHCPGVFIKNPDRVRERGYCRLCDHYVCDPCHAAMHAPNYVHRTRWALLDAALNAATHGRSFDSSQPSKAVSIIVP